jgi:hypothetical protein
MWLGSIFASCVGVQWQASSCHLEKLEITDNWTKIVQQKNFSSNCDTKNDYRHPKYSGSGLPLDSGAAHQV